MSYPLEQSNYVRAISVAGAIIASQDTGDLDAKGVALNVLDLAKELAAGQDKYFAKAGWTGATSTPSPASKPSSPASSGGGQSLTPKQRGALTKAYKGLDAAGETPPYTMDDIEALEGKERSEAIGLVFDAAFGG